MKERLLGSGKSLKPTTYVVEVIRAFKGEEAIFGGPRLLDIPTRVPRVSIEELAKHVAAEKVARAWSQRERPPAVLLLE